MKTILSSAVCLIFVGCANTSHYPGQVYFPTPDNNNIGVASGLDIIPHQIVIQCLK
jgi:hypothetical protein